MSIKTKESKDHDPPWFSWWVRAGESLSPWIRITWLLQCSMSFARGRPALFPNLWIAHLLGAGWSAQLLPPVTSLALDQRAAPAVPTFCLLLRGASESTKCGVFRGRGRVPRSFSVRIASEWVSTKPVNGVSIYQRLWALFQSLNMDAEHLYSPSSPIISLGTFSLLSEVKARSTFCDDPSVPGLMGNVGLSTRLPFWGIWNQVNSQSLLRVKPSRL